MTRPNRLPRVAVASLIAICAWPTTAVRTTNVVDDGWRFGLDDARRSDADFGDVAFTYGPLAFLDGGPAFSTVGLIGSFLVQLGVMVGLAWFILSFLEGRMRPAVATALTWFAAITVFPTERLSEVIAALAVAWTIVLLGTRGETLAWIPIAALAGVWVSVKPTVALLLLATAVVAAVVRPRNPHLGDVSFAPFPVALATLSAGLTWLAAGQSLTALPSFLHGWREVASGFAGAMGSAPRLSFETLYAGVLPVAALVLLPALVLATRGLGLSARIGIVGLAIMTVVWARQVALVRADIVHLRSGAIAAILLVVAVMALDGHGRILRLLRLGLQASFVVLLATLALDVVVLTPTGHQSALTASRPPVAHNAVAFVDGLVDISTGNRTRAVQDHYAESLDLDDAIVQYIADKPGSVHVAPAINLVAHGNDLDLWTLPVIQEYTSYTNVLEQSNIDALLADDGPRYVLRGRPFSPVRGEHPAWLAPGLVAQTWCNFAMVVTDGEWSLLERRETPCTQSFVDELSLDRDGRYELSADAPGCAGATVLALDGLEPSPTEDLMALVARPTRLSLEHSTQQWPLVRMTAAQPHLVSLPSADWTWLPMQQGQLDLQDGIRIAGFEDPQGVRARVECWSHPR